MPVYHKTEVHNMISVRSIVTAFRIDLNGIVTRDDVHDFPEIFYMAQGQGFTVISGKKLFLKAGQMVIYAPHAIHGGGSGGSAEIISFETENPLPSSLFNQVITLSGEKRLLLSSMIEQALALLEPRAGIYGMALKQNADPYALQAVKNHLELFLLDLMRPPQTYAMSRMDQVTDYMIQNISRVLTLDKICTDLGFSVATLRRLVQKCCGQSPIAYFNGLKILEAQRLIAQTPLNNTEIAERLGFSSVHHFSKAFKQKTGIAPTEYAKASRI